MKRFLTYCILIVQYPQFSLSKIPSKIQKSVERDQNLIRPALGIWASAKKMAPKMVRTCKNKIGQNMKLDIFFSSKTNQMIRKLQWEWYAKAK